MESTHRQPSGLVKGMGAWQWQHLLLICNLTSHLPGRFIHLPIMTRNEHNKVSQPTEKHYTRLTKNNKEPENLIVTVPYLIVSVPGNFRCLSDTHRSPCSFLARSNFAQLICFLLTRHSLVLVHSNPSTFHANDWLGKWHEF